MAFAGCFFVLLLVMKNQTFLSTHDDVWFPKTYQSYESIFAWIHYRYHAWSGRVLIDSVLPVILGAHVWWWRLGTVAAFMALMAGMFVVAGQTKKQRDSNGYIIVLFAFFAIFATEKEVLASGAFWATGSMNYLWPAACLVTTLAVVLQSLDDQPVRWYRYLAVLPFAAFASYQEQTAVIGNLVMAFVLVDNYLSGRKVNAAFYLLFLVVIINSLVLFLAPGNIVRMDKELLKFYPNFHAVSLLEKAYFGLNFSVLNHWLYDSVRHFFILALLTSYLTIKNTASVYLRALCIIPLGYVLVCIVFGRVLGGSYAALVNLAISVPVLSNAGIHLPPLSLLPTVTGTVVMALLPVLWLLVFRYSQLFKKAVILYSSAIIASFAVSFSPTLFASGPRLFFIPDMMMVFVAVLLFSEGLQHINYRNRLFHVCCAYLGYVGIARIVFFVTG